MGELKGASYCASICFTASVVGRVALVSLRACLDEAKSAILDGHFDTAVDRCSTVLASYPRHVEAHWLLGEALREKGLGEQAERVFLRVLSADPENLIARWALSILFEEREDIEGALHHLERAFELNPGHSELRGELARLSPRSVSLNRAALARLYARGELWEKVVEELGVVLELDPQRLDLMVLMAEALWRLYVVDEAGRTGEAGAGSEQTNTLRERMKTLCEEILEDSPDCLKANLILGHLLMSEGGESLARAESLLSCARTLDPENLVEADLLRDSWNESLQKRAEQRFASSAQAVSGPMAEEPSSGPAAPTPGLDTQVESPASTEAAALESTAEESTAGQVDSSWDDLLKEDVALDDVARIRLAEAIARLASTRRRTAPGRSVLASVEQAERPDDEVVAQPSDADSNVVVL